MAISNLKRGRAAGSDELSPGIFKDSGPVFAVRLTDTLAQIWGLNAILSDWSRSLVIPVYKKEQNFSCENHRGISLANILSKILA
ncbi:unnamed protein product [Schistosoma mattheei]|uniref:Uncharacterized protein n=1 Tax=Schistosoma mattheei TaxID=31246 RepID=A0A183PBR1_9TREM|nr:unnamed protein product [Schistosoma mattheei]